MLVNGIVIRKMMVLRKDRCILALLIASLRAERFCDGALLGFIKNGAVTRWLKRLQKLDEA